MADKDMTEKTLEAWNDVFCDIMNVLLFDGNYCKIEGKIEGRNKEKLKEKQKR